MNKVKCKETGMELRDCVWVYQGTDSNDRLCIASDEEMEHHPDPIGWNIFVPEELVKRANGETSTHLAQAMSLQKENTELKKLWGERTEQKNVAEDKVEKAKAILQEWLDKQGHERCWYYPDLFSKLALELGVKPIKEPVLPSREEFECGCKKYQDEQFKK